MRPRILVVEDEQIVAMDIQRTLQGLGYDVPDLVASGSKAIETAETLQPDLVLMDIRLRGPMDGITAAHMIRERWDIPVVYLTAHADPDTLQRAKITEPFGYVLKPFEGRDLQTTVEMALYKYKIDRKLRESESWLSATLSSIGDGVIATDWEGRIVFINPVAQSLTGWNGQQAVGRPLGEVFRIINEFTREPVEDPVAKVLATGLTVGLANHTILLARDGTEHPIDDSGAPIQAPGGQLQGVVLVFRDITERREADAKLRESEQRFKTLASHAPVGIFQTDAEGHCLFVNKRWCEMAGMSPHEAQGRGWARALHPEDHDHIFFEWYNATKTNREFASEYRFCTPEGRITWVFGSAIALRQEDGTVTGYIGTVTDITQRRLAEEAVRAAQKELQIVTESMSVPVTRCSRELRYLWANQPYATWVGRPSSEIIGRPIIDVLGQKAFDRLLPRFEHVLSGKRVEYEEEVEFLGIGPRWVNAVYTPTSNSDGAVDGWVAVVFDITEHRRLEIALKESDRRKDEFLATLAHELRNPLAPITSSVAVMKALSIKDPDVIMLRNVIDRQVQHMARLLDDLLDVSRITTGKLEIRKERVSLRVVLDTAIETSRPLIDARGQKLTVSLPSETVHLDADPVRLAQVFANLLNNAAKFTNDGGQIWLTAERQNDEVLISIKDNGIGIPSETLERVFDMFSQGKPMLDRASGGLGIGLSLVRALVELQGGSVVAHSDGAGRGSEFIVRLPIIIGRAEVDPTHSQPRELPQNVVKKRLLVVDDLKDSASSLARLIQLMGHEASTAHDGEEAIHLAEVLQPDVILLDIGMPKLNGYEACRRIRERQWGKNIYIVALTGWGQDDHRAQTKEAGFNCHLVKPVDLTILRELLDSLPAKGIAPTRVDKPTD